MSSHILVVEDDGRIADLIARNLQAAGFSCVLAADGDRALAEPVLGDLDRPRLLVDSPDVACQIPEHRPLGQR